MFNPVIIIAVIIQGIISKSSRILGGFVGLIITTGILIWGLSVYAEGNIIAFFNLPLTKEMFIVACLIWYGINLWECKSFINVIRKNSLIKKVLESPLMNEEHVVNFYQNTLNAWSGGKMSSLNEGFEKEGKLPYEDFIKSYPPYEGSALNILFTKFSPKEGEYLIGFGDLDTVENSGWFVLTNFRLIQRDGRKDEYCEVALSDVDSFEEKASTENVLSFKMKTGEEVVFEDIKVCPTEEFLSKAITQSLVA